MERKGLIEFVEWFIKEPRMLTNWNYIEYIDEYYNSINSASNESQSVRENVGGEIKCHSKQKYFEDCEAHNKIYCEGCKYFY